MAKRIRTGTEGDRDSMVPVKSVECDASGIP